METEKDGPDLIDVLSVLNQASEHEPDPDEELVIITDWTVKSDGRLTIPGDKREKYGIEEGEDVDGLLLVSGE